MAKRMPPGWEPPYPAYDVELPPSIEVVVSAYLGVQRRGGGSPEDALAALRQALEGPDGPESIERAYVVDPEGHRDEFFVAYWTSPARYARWEAAEPFRRFWADPRWSTGPIGVWREVLAVPRQRFEVNFSDRFKAGLSTAGTGHRVERAHGYWGSARDRIAASEGNALESPLGAALAAPVVRETLGRRLRVRCPENLCVIRSGQDWSLCEGEHRDDYLAVMEPVLRAGMELLRDDPRATGCCSNRYARFTDLDGAPRDETAGIAHFLTLGHLEAWAEHHPTHVAIFKTILELLQKHHFQVPLRLWHEVLVLPADGQIFEYVNCHPRTGLLRWFEATELA